jgi:hypothetical protein
MDTCPRGISLSEYEYTIAACRHTAGARQLHQASYCWHVFFSAHMSASAPTHPVTLVLRKAVLWVLRVQLQHQPVTRHLQRHTTQQ